jgi:hypothetical protein
LDIKQELRKENKLRIYQNDKFGLWPELCLSTSYRVENSMLGELIGETTGKTSGQRVFDLEGPAIETNVSTHNIKS